MKNFRKKVCENCDNEYYPTSSTQKWCIDCRTVNCPVCGKEKVLKPSKIKAGRMYCGPQCAGEAKKNQIERTCLYCGETFITWPSSVKHRGGNYCNKSCKTKHQWVLGISSKQGDLVKCEYCGKEFYKRPIYLKRSKRHFCCDDHARISQKGEGNPNWRGGVAFEPYCELFNEDFKERVRDFFGRACQMCGRTEIDNGKRLSVHHINYDKETGCNSNNPLFIPVCQHCHGKTNYNRKYWEDVFSNFIMVWFDGVCYLPK